MRVFRLCVGDFESAVWHELDNGLHAVLDDFDCACRIIHSADHFPLAVFDWFHGSFSFLSYFVENCCSTSHINRWSLRTSCDTMFVLGERKSRAKLSCSMMTPFKSWVVSVVLVKMLVFASVGIGDC